MKTDKVVRRALFTVAVSTASLVTMTGSELLAFETGVRASVTGIQRVQYQPAQATQNVAQPNPNVTAELKRLFEESGQPMPSMNTQDLPNAQAPIGNSIRPTQRPGTATGSIPPASATHVPAPSPAAPAQAPRKSMLQKFMGKISGKDKKAAEAAVVPPVPPGFREPAPAPPSSSPQFAEATQGNFGVQNSGQRNMSSPNAAGAPSAVGTSSSGMSNSSAQKTAARPVSSSQVQPGAPRTNTSAMTAQVPSIGRAAIQARPVSQPSQPVPAVPDKRAATTNQIGTKTNSAATPRYVQPGRAPAFMPPVASQPGTVQPGAVQNTKENTAHLEAKQPVAVTANKPEEDGLDELFNDSDAATDTLDLDELVNQGQGSVVASESRASEDSAVVDSAVESSPASSEGLKSTSMPVEIDADSAKEASGETSSMEQKSPLTGVRLDHRDEEFFDTELSGREPVHSPSGQPESSTSGDSLPFGDPVPPMEDFDNSLPAIDLPSVEDLSPDSDDSEVDEAVPHDESEKSSDVADANSTSVSGKAALRNSESERLQQAVAQDRRLRQQRMIQSRAGQFGFKGYCPVELRDRRELVETDPRYTATFGLQTYSFASAAAKTAFESDPARYAPAAGGNDVVLLVNSGEEQPGMLDYALWYRDRLYLFRSRETMALFNEEPLKFANQY